MHGQAETSVVPRMTWVGAHLALFAIAVWWLAGGIEVVTGTPAGDPLRRLVLVTFGAVLWVRMALTALLLLRRRLGWDEAGGIIAAVALYQLGFAWTGAGQTAPIGPVDVAGMVLFAGGSALNTGAELRRRRFKDDPANAGRLYTGGAFALVRHPNYLGDILWLLGWAMLTRHPLALVVPIGVGAAFAWVFAPTLSRHLASRYGEQYTAWAARTPALVPGASAIRDWWRTDRISLLQRAAGASTDQGRALSAMQTRGGIIRGHPHRCEVAAEHRSMVVNGVRLHLRESGAADAPQVIVLHGIMGHAYEWEPLVRALSDAFRVVAVDQRGHGESAWAEDYSLEAFVGDATALLERLGSGPRVVIGHSLGGMVAMRVAAERPDLVERLIVIDIGPDSVATEWGQAELPVMLRAMADLRYAAVDEALAGWMAADPRSREPHLRRYLEHVLVPKDGMLSYVFDAEGLATFPASVTSAKLWNAAEGIRAPTMLVRGVHSDVLPATQAQQVLARLRNGRLVEVADAGHDLGVQQPERVADAALEFLHEGRRPFQSGRECRS